MPRQVARRGPRFSRTERQPTNWSRVVETAMVIVPPASKVLMHNLVLSNPGINETVRRTRGLLLVNSDQISVQEEQFGALGAMVVSDTAIAVGIASLPDPVTDKDDDGWMLWVPFLQVTGSGGGAVQTANPGLNRYDFDSKAMRKVQEGYGVVYVVANASASFSIEVGLTLSVLTSRS